MACRVLTRPALTRTQPKGALLNEDPLLRHNLVKEILFEASQLAGAQRRAFLDSACAGDAALRAEVESLLAYQPAHEIAAGAGNGGGEAGPARTPETGEGGGDPPRGAPATRKR